MFPYSTVTLALYFSWVRTIWIQALSGTLTGIIAKQTVM
jgi:hypothetical protein